MSKSNEDARLSNDDNSDLLGSRETRRSSDRNVTENRELTEADRLEMFRQQLFNDALPDLPELSGFHVCWLTTTNPRDSVHRRMQLGYEPVRAEEVPGMAYASLKTGEYAGMIGVNEMVAFKLPMSLYQAYMKEAHHDAPQREEQKLADVADSIREQAERHGSKIIEGDGNEEVRNNARAPLPVFR